MVVVAVVAVVAAAVVVAVAVPTPVSRKQPPPPTGKPFIPMADAMTAFFMVLSSLIRSFQMRGGTLCLLGLPRLMGTIMLTGYYIVNL